MSPDSIKILERAAIQWDRTELLLKKVEFVDQQVLAPAINELRYAGRRLVDAVRIIIDPDKDNEQALVIISEVEQFCYRAQHDCIDAIVIYQHDVLTLMEATFGYDLLLKHYTGYLILRGELNEVAEICIASRGDRGKRVELYNSIEENRIPKIIGFIKNLKSSEDILKAIALSEKKKEEDRQRELADAHEAARIAKASESSAFASLDAAKKTLGWTRFGVVVALFVGGIGCWLTYLGVQSAASEKKHVELGESQKASNDIGSSKQTDKNAKAVKPEVPRH